MDNLEELCAKVAEKLPAARVLHPTWHWEDRPHFDDKACPEPGCKGWKPAPVDTVVVAVVDWFFVKKTYDFGLRFNGRFWRVVPSPYDDDDTRVSDYEGSWQEALLAAWLRAVEAEVAP